MEIGTERTGVRRSRPIGPLDTSWGLAVLGSLFLFRRRPRRDGEVDPDPPTDEQLARREAEAMAREEQLRYRIADLERQLQEAGTTPANGSSGATPESEEEARLKELELRERSLAAREMKHMDRVRDLRNQATEREAQKEALRIKEQNLVAWEARLRQLKAAIDHEALSIQQARRELKELGPEAQSIKRLEDLRDELARREDELRSRETLLRNRLEEAEAELPESLPLTGRGGASGKGESASSKGPKAEEARVSTGIRRLDDLLYGGLPIGSQTLLNGPAHTGKELLARLFVADGLKRGVPAVWVLTDKTFEQVQQEMTGILPSYPDLERKGMIRYVDLYSKRLGVAEAGRGVKLLSPSDKKILSLLSSSVNSFATELKKKSDSYRLVFESVSTVTAYLDASSTLDFLQPFTGRRKLENGSAYYNLETGMHSESDIETLEHMVDGSINLKVDQLRTFLSVRGLTDVQSRAWVSYTFSKNAFLLGSFSLDHIR